MKHHAKFRASAARILPAAVVFILLSTVLLPRAGAWWSGGHTTITEAAVRGLPDDVPEFFRKAETALAEMSLQPDDWKSATTPHLRGSEQPEHFIDLEYLDGEKLPEQRYDLLKLYAAKKVDMARGGTLPYALIEGYERLMLAFREHRNKPQSETVKQRVIVYAGWLAHYCQDAAMPLHTTKHFDGRYEKGQVKQKGIHARLDGYPEKNQFTAKLMGEGLKPQHRANVWPLIVEAIQKSHTFVDKAYELDAAGGFDAKPEPAREFVLERTRAAVQLTMDLWYSAWVNSDPAKATIR